MDWNQHQKKKGTQTFRVFFLSSFLLFFQDKTKEHIFV